jgi:uncharacterized protein (TIGR00730 family)
MPDTTNSFTPKGSMHESVFLQGPRSRWKELSFVFSVARQFIHGFRKLHFVGPCVTVFGSARFDETHPYYEEAREMGRQIVKMGFTVITGGGPGIMEAANRGAQEAGGRSIGCNIVLPKEQKPNKYLDRWVNIDYFFVRKILLTKYSYAFVVMPGGYGTMDEFFEAITLMQTGKTLRFPVILMGKGYHEELFRYIQNMVEEKTISPEDMGLFLFTDSVSEAINHINKYAVEGYGLKEIRKIKPFSFLGEHH